MCNFTLLIANKVIGIKRFFFYLDRRIRILNSFSVWAHAYQSVDYYSIVIALDIDPISQRLLKYVRGLIGILSIDSMDERGEITLNNGEQNT